MPIEEIKSGDEVLSYNQQTKQTEYKSVIETCIRQTETIVKLNIEGEIKQIETTPEHPFFVRIHRARDSIGDDDGEWKSAGELQTGDEVLSANGVWQKVESVERQARSEQVYNFAVADNHNYFVGQNGTLVHNNYKDKGLWELTKERTSKMLNHRYFGKFSKHDSSGLWWSRDITGHGDSVFKVHRETSKGLEWLADADEYGDFILNKHKGPTGLFIPWSELH